MNASSILLPLSVQPPHLAQATGTPTPAAKASGTATPRTPTPRDTPRATTAQATASPAAPPESLLEHNQFVIYYGLPGSPGNGILGDHSAADSAGYVREEAARYDALNGDRAVKPTLDLIYAQVQADPTPNGLYLRYLPRAVVDAYLRLADQQDLQIMLDVQIGRGDPLAEVKKLERYLRNPRVHVAIDPEYAVGPDGIPIETPGTITGDQINAIQEYVAGVVQSNGLPSKLIVVHQYMEETILGGEAIRAVPGTDLVFNMDAFGAISEKIDKYEHFATRPYALHHGFNVFVRLDDRIMTEQEVLAMNPQPEVIFYQ